MSIFNNFKLPQLQLPVSTQNDKFKNTEIVIKITRKSKQDINGLHIPARVW